MEAKFCGKCGTPVDEQGVCPVCTQDSGFADIATKPAPAKKRKKKLFVIILALALVAAITLTTVFVVLPLFKKSEDNTFYSSGVGAFKTDSDVMLFDTDLGLVNVKSDSKITVYPFGREESSWADNGDYNTHISKKNESVCVGNDIYVMNDDIYKVQIAKDGSYKEEVWLSAAEIEALNLGCEEYGVPNSFFVSRCNNLQYYNGYIYYSKTMPITEEPTSSELVNVIGRIDVKDKSVEILKIMEDYSYNFDYVVYGDWIYYTARCFGPEYENTNIFRVRTDGTEDSFVYEGMVLELSVYKDKLYFYDGESMCSMNLDGSQKQVILVGLSSWQIISDVRFYTIDSANNKMYVVTNEKIKEVDLEDYTERTIAEGEDLFMFRNVFFLDSKLYLEFDVNIGRFASTAFLADGKTETVYRAEYGTKENPLCAGFIYDTQDKSVNAVCTYNEQYDENNIGENDLQEALKCQQYFIRSYIGEEFSLGYGMTTSIKFYE